MGSVQLSINRRGQSPAKCLCDQHMGLRKRVATVHVGMYMIQVLLGEAQSRGSIILLPKLLNGEGKFHPRALLFRSHTSRCPSRSLSLDFNPFLRSGKIRWLACGFHDKYPQQY